LTTPASADLAELILRDAAEIQMEDVAFKQKRHRKEGRRGQYPEQPLYTLRDVERTLPLLRGVDYGRSVPLGPRASATFHDAGHILGSAMFELAVFEDDASRRIIFSTPP
jgi:metallo-beta-lactamase family protein